MIIRSFLLLVITCIVSITHSQSGYWQQKIKYVMDIDMDVETNRFTGKQKLEYWNNSPDTLREVYYHLYWNAFQPGSMMDERSRRQGEIMVNNKQDWDARVKDRIANLKPDEMGYQKINTLKMNNQPQQYEVLGTILKVNLSKPILPKQKVVFDMAFEAQVPLQIRRSGRDNPTTKVRYSMSQWYPKLCEYDRDGWHATPYVGREFYGVWGDFDVNISIDKKYILGGTGYLTNANQIGYGYEDAGVKVPLSNYPKLTWKFTAPNVHDFMWAADPEFVHQTRKVPGNITLHLLYKPAGRTAKDWENILVDAEKAYPYIIKNFGAYPYKQYSFITGGDGGMEYPMATLLASPGAWLHEWMHNWYQGVLATNESLYAWMDEGFTSYAEAKVADWLHADSTLREMRSNYTGYYNLVRSEKEEPLTTHADHFNTNYAYSSASYSKGAVFLEQLGYIVGAQVRDKVLLDYYQQWKFKHPDVNDFMRVAQKASNLQLQWYKEYWVNITKTIDYAIDSIWEEGSKTNIRLRNDGLMPMPIDLMITAKDGKKELHYIPLDLMYGAKPVEDIAVPRKVYAPWPWTRKKYIIQTDTKLRDMSIIEIDPSQRMADVVLKNNKLKLM